MLHHQFVFNVHQLLSHRIAWMWSYAHTIKKYWKSAKLCNDERKKKNPRRSGCVSVTCHKYTFVSHFMYAHCSTPSSAYEKLNFIHESLRHISLCVFFLFVFFCSLAAETLFFFRHSFSLVLFFFNTNPTLHSHLTETKMYVRACKNKNFRNT